MGKNSYWIPWNDYLITNIRQRLEIEQPGLKPTELNTPQGKHSDYSLK
jgi:hypothetical protein